MSTYTFNSRFLRPSMIHSPRLGASASEWKVRWGQPPTGNICQTHVTVRVRCDCQPISTSERRRACHATLPRAFLWKVFRDCTQKPPAGELSASQASSGHCLDDVAPNKKLSNGVFSVRGVWFEAFTWKAFNQRQLSHKLRAYQREKHPVEVFQRGVVRGLSRGSVRPAATLTQGTRHTSA
jgi:hypothetical protein